MKILKNLRYKIVDDQGNRIEDVHYKRQAIKRVEELSKSLGDTDVLEFKLTEKEKIYFGDGIEPNWEWMADYEIRRELDLKSKVQWCKDLLASGTLKNQKDIDHRKGHLKGYEEMLVAIQADKEKLRKQYDKKYSAFKAWVLKNRERIKKPDVVVGEFGWQKIYNSIKERKDSYYYIEEPLDMSNIDTKGLWTDYPHADHYNFNGTRGSVGPNGLRWNEWDKLPKDIKQLSYAKHCSFQYSKHQEYKRLSG